jgi:hypothetical protein
MKQRKTVRKQRGSGIFVKSTVRDIINNKLNLEQLKLLQKELSNRDRDYGVENINIVHHADRAGRCPDDDIDCYREYLTKAYDTINLSIDMQYRNYSGKLVTIYTPKKENFQRNDLVAFLKTIYKGSWF